ncbi:hypothetical protein ACSCB1_39385 [Streptomyces europaeiscabiei]|nr:hypothetical protein [Streptomyces europaeiscabiei]
MRAGFRTWIAIAGAAMLVASGATGASADTAAESAVGDWSRCVKKVDEGGGFPGIWRYVSLENRCGKTIKVIVVWNNGGDDPCKRISRDITWQSESQTLASYEGAKYC